MENMVDMEAIRNPIHAFLPVQCLMCEMVHHHHEKGFFFFLKCGRFFLILSTNVPNNSA